MNRRQTIVRWRGKCASSIREVSPFFDCLTPEPDDEKIEDYYSSYAGGGFEGSCLGWALGGGAEDEDEEAA